MKVLWRRGINTLYYWNKYIDSVSNSEIKISCDKGGTNIIEKIDDRTYISTYNFCSLSGGFQELNGKLIITVEDEAKDKVKVKVVGGVFSFRDNNAKRYELSSGTSAEFEDGGELVLGGEATVSYKGNVKVFSFSGTVNAFNLVFNNLNFSGEFDNSDVFKIENAHFTGSFETFLGKV